MGFRITKDKKEKLVRPRFTKEQAIMLAEDYKTMSLRKVASKWGCDKTVISRTLKKHGFSLKSANGPVRGENGRVLSKEQELLVLSRYEDNVTESLASLAEHFGVSSDVIRHILLRGKKNIRAYAKKRDDLAFDQAATHPESAYHVGFFMADGYMNEKRKAICFGLKSGDIAAVEEFKRFLKAGHDICHTNRRGHPFSKISIHSEPLYDRLLSYGVTPRKSMKQQFNPTFLASCTSKAEEALWRGYVCGNGSLACRLLKNGSYIASLNISGSAIICEQFSQFVKSRGISNPNKITGCKANHNKYAVYSGIKSIELMRLLFIDAEPALKRKQEIALFAIQLYDNKKLLVTQRR